MIAEKPQYERYPLTMTHGAFRPAVIRPVQNGPVTDYHGTSERLPPVTVRNEDEEAYYGAQGYEPAGKVDPAAWVQRHADPPPENYVPQKYPMVGKDGQLIRSAAEDPDATPEDLAVERAVEASVQTSNPEVDALRAQLAAMNEQMKLMAEQFAARAQPPVDRLEHDRTETKYGEVVAETTMTSEALSDPPKRGPGRPRKE